MFAYFPYYLYIDLKIMEKAHRCSIAGCDQSFATIVELLSHLRAFHARSVCVEDGCNRVFTTRDGLCKHVQSVHKGVRYSCECGQEWSYSSNYYQHLPCPSSRKKRIKTKKDSDTFSQPKFAGDLRKEKEKNIGTGKEEFRFDPFDPLRDTCSSAFGSTSGLSTDRYLDPFANPTGHGFLSSTKTSSGTASTSGYSSRSSISSDKSAPLDFSTKSATSGAKKDMRLNPFAAAVHSDVVAGNSAITAEQLSSAMKKQATIGVQCDLFGSGKQKTATVSTQTSEYFY